MAGGAKVAYAKAEWVQARDRLDKDADAKMDDLIGCNCSASQTAIFEP